MSNGKVITGIGGVMTVAGVLVAALSAPIVGIPLGVLGVVVLGCGLATGDAPPVPPPAAAPPVPQIPAQGTNIETPAPFTLKPDQVEARWRQFLGPGPYSQTHPRTGAHDPDRIVSADGRRSIRYGGHERNSSATKHHFHEETWTLDQATNTMNVDNLMVRVPLGGKNPDPLQLANSKAAVAQTFQDLL